MPAEIQTEGDLESELTYGNIRRVAKCGGEVLTKATVDIGPGRAIVFPVTRAKDILGLRIPLVGVAVKKKLRIIHDLSFSGDGSTVPKTILDEGAISDSGDRM